MSIYISHMKNIPTVYVGVISFLIILLIFMVLVRGKSSNEPGTNLGNLRKIQDFSRAFMSHIRSNMKTYDQSQAKKFKRLLKRFDPDKIYSSKSKTYSYNKGMYIKFCTEYYNDNVGKYVILHEMGHVMTKSYGHTEAFWCNFRSLLFEAERSGLYNSINYASQPEEYCNMIINNNVMFDMMICSQKK